MAPPTGDRDKPGKLYLGGLSFSTEEDKLKELFLKYGKVAEVQVIKDKVSGVSRGFGFVSFLNPADAEDAVSGMDGMEVDGKYIKVAHALKSKNSERQSDGRPDDRGRGPPSRGGSSSRGPRGSFNKPPPWSGGSWYESQSGRTSSRDSRGRGRGPPLMDVGRGGGGSYRGRGGPPRSLLGRGDEDYGSGRATAPPPRSSRLSPYAREDELDVRRPSAASYERKSRFEDLDIPERSSRTLSAYGRQPAAYDGLPPAREARLPASSYGREPDGYGSLPSERASRAPPASYDREPAAYGREAAVYGRGELAYADRQSSYPTEREGAAVARHAVLDDPYAGRSREPALSEYPASRPVARDYPVVERSARAELVRDPYARDPYAAAAREPAVARDYERARELPSVAPLEREVYPQSRTYPAAPREPASRPVSDYERPLAREFPSERNGAYGRERESRDPYGAASARASRYESYPAARDAYASAPRTEKPAYGARDPYGAVPAARSAYSHR